MNSVTNHDGVTLQHRPDLIDPGLLRPGRLDRLIYLSAPSKEDQRRIFTALTRKYDMDPDFDIETVLGKCNANFTGADMYARCSVLRNKVLLLEDAIADPTPAFSPFSSG
jgi:ATP-dependent 26S proteasome regulatory subunit